MKMDNFLNRYTSLPILLDILKRQEITLLDPQFWEDRNDSYCIEQYKTRGKYQTVLGLCFSAARETSHHWKIFSSGLSGVCIEFDKKKLLDYLPDKKGFKHDSVEYLTINRLETQGLQLERIPFVKRYAYRDEKEYRIIYESCDVAVATKGFAIKLDCVRKITLSPWLPKSVFETVSGVINSFLGHSGISLNKSTLIESSRWRSAISDGRPNKKPSA